MNDHNAIYIQQLLEKYQQGKCTPEEEEVIEAWYDQLAPGQTNFLENNPAFATGAEARLVSQLPGLQAPVRRRAVVRTLTFRWAAAAVLLGIIITASFYLLPNLQPSAKPVITRISAPGNQIKIIQLPDGSKIWLNRFSRVEWAGDLTDSIRLVTLEGEARFEVAHDAAHPFVVKTGNTATRVLGTVFNVEAYAEESEIKVSLLQGSVQFNVIAPTPQSALLQPGNMVRYQKGSHQLNVSAFTNEVDGWTKGVMVFNEVPLTDAIARIARQQQWKIVWKGKKNEGATVSAAFSHETPQQMLEGIAFTHHLHFKIEQQTLFIY